MNISKLDLSKDMVVIDGETYDIYTVPKKYRDICTKIINPYANKSTLSFMIVGELPTVTNEDINILGSAISVTIVDTTITVVPDVGVFVDTIYTEYSELSTDALTVVAVINVALNKIAKTKLEPFTYNARNSTVNFKLGRHHVPIAELEVERLSPQQLVQYVTITNALATKLPDNFTPNVELPSELQIVTGTVVIVDKWTILPGAVYLNTALIEHTVTDGIPDWASELMISLITLNTEKVK